MNGGTELEARVAAVIRDELQVEVDTPATDLIDTGLIDSLALVTLITALESELGFELPLDDFDVDVFRSVERIAAFAAPHLPDAAGERSA